MAINALICAAVSDGLRIDHLEVSMLLACSSHCRGDKKRGFIQQFSSSCLFRLAAMTAFGDELRKVLT